MVELRPNVLRDRIIPRWFYDHFAILSPCGGTELQREDFAEVAEREQLLKCLTIEAGLFYVNLAMIPYVFFSYPKTACRMENSS